MAEPGFDIERTRAQSHAVIRAGYLLVRQSDELIRESNARAALHQQRSRDIGDRATKLAHRNSLPWPPART